MQKVGPKLWHILFCLFLRSVFGLVAVFWLSWLGLVWFGWVN